VLSKSLKTKKYRGEHKTFSKREAIESYALEK
jgi:hypothetical protein